MGLFKKVICKVNSVHQNSFLLHLTLPIFKMIFPEAMMHDRVWFDEPKYVEEREHYELFLTNNLTLEVSKSHAPIFTEETKAVAEKASSSLIGDIEKAQKNIRDTLSGVESAKVVTEASSAEMEQLKAENSNLKELVNKLSEQVSALSIRVTKLEEGKSAAQPAPPAEPEKKVEDDDDDDAEDDDWLFGSDEEEETEEEKKRKEELVAKYKEKKEKKVAIVAKSSILLDVKPWDDETDMKEMERLVRTVETDGLVWGAAKLIPVGYGIKKLQIMCVVEDEKVGTEFLDEEITKFEDLVQSVDVAAFNKI